MADNNKRKTEIIAIIFIVVMVVLSLVVLHLVRLNQQRRDAYPTKENVRSAMGIPSTATVRGQRDAVGFASTRAQMKEIDELSDGAPAPEMLGEIPAGRVVGVISPHDDYVYAGRVYKRILAPVKAKRVIILGVFHGWRKFKARDHLYFDDYSSWRTPDGRLKISSLRGEILQGLPKGDAVVDDLAHDSEHSVEAIAYWLKHNNPEVEIVPVLVSTMGFKRMQKLAGDLSAAVQDAEKKHDWKLGDDLQVVISSDAVHYGPDFEYTPFGEGGIEAYQKAVEQDINLIEGPLSGQISDDKVKDFFGQLCDPSDPARYKITWCGRFSIPFGLLFMDRLGTVTGHPVAYATSVGWPQLKVKGDLPSTTAPCSLYHFVGLPAVAYTLK